jgi:hypothetical protein
MIKMKRKIKSLSVIFLSIAFLFHGVAYASPSGSGVMYHEFATICPRSTNYDVSVNGQDAFVYYTSAGSFVSYESNGATEIEVRLNEKVSSVRVLPLKYGIEPEIDGNTLRFALPGEAKVLVDINHASTLGKEQLFIYANPVVAQKPNPGDPAVHFFKAGQVYEVGQLALKDGETVYIEGGAVVRGNILATSVKDITIGGLGVIDGSYYKYKKGNPKTILTEDCSGVTIKGITMIEPQAWTLMLYYTQDVMIDNIKQITTGHGSDGIDIVSSRNVKISNSILRNGDDCIVVKAFQRDEYATPVHNTAGGVKNVLVTGCSVQANMGGQAFEIGHELLQVPIANITFKNCDVLGVHGQGGVFGIHNSDNATVRDVTYEDIRVDHFYNKLVDIRVIKSRWSDSEDRGKIENVLLKDIQVKASRYNPGYSISLIGGYSGNHKVKKVVFDNFRLNGEKITNPDQMDLYIKQAKEIRFK